MRLRIGALLGLLALAGCQSAVNAMYGMGDCKLEKLGEAPVETHSKLVVVSVGIDGRHGTRRSGAIQVAAPE